MRKNAFAFIAFVLVPFLFVNAQDNSEFSLNDTVQLHSRIKKGKLNNGLSYFVDNNSHLAGQASMRFVIKVGSLQEAPEEAGFSHFLEHMAFVGTSHFPNAISHFQQLGLKVGSDINGHTTLNYSCFELNIPAKLEILKDGLLFFRDCSNSMLLKEDEIDKQRKVIAAEYNGSPPNLISEQLQYKPLIVENNAYLKKFFANAYENLNQFKSDALEQFYRRWYRPDLQAVIVVGDVNAAEIEKMIIDTFTDITEPEIRHEPTIEYSAPAKWNSDFVIATRSGTSHLGFDIYRNKPFRKPETYSDYAWLLKCELVNSMMRERINSLLDRYDPPFRNAMSKISFQDPAPFISSLFTHIELKDDRVKEGIQAVIGEMEKLRRFGFTLTELDEAKKKMGEEVMGNTNSADIASSLIAYFTGDAMAGELYNLKSIYWQIVGDISAKDVQSVISEWMNVDGADFVFFAPESKKVLLPEREVVLNWIKEVQLSNLAAPVHHLSTKNFEKLHETVVSKSKVRRNHAVGVTELVLSNGIKAILKPCHSTDSLIYIRAINQSETQIEDEYLMNLAVSLISQSGLETFNFFELKRFLKKKGVRRIGLYTENGFLKFEAALVPSGVETSFHAIHNYLTKRRIDPEALEYRIKQIKKDTSLYQAKCSSLNIPTLISLYDEHFYNQNNFTFVISGSFDKRSIEPILEKYLGSLRTSFYPRLGHKKVESDSLTLLNRPPKRNSKLFEVKLMLTGYYKYSPKNNASLDLLNGVLNSKLTHRLREIEGEVYSVAVVNYYNLSHGGSYGFTISFSCPSENVDYLVSASLEEVRDIQRVLTENDLGGIKAQELSQLERRLSSCDFWSHYLIKQSESGESLNYILNYRSEVKRANTKSVGRTLRKYFKEARIEKAID